MLYATGMNTRLDTRHAQLEKKKRLLMNGGGSLRVVLLGNREFSRMVEMDG